MQDVGHSHCIVLEARLISMQTSLAESIGIEHLIRAGGWIVICTPAWRQ